MYTAIGFINATHNHDDGGQKMSPASYKNADKLLHSVAQIEMDMTSKMDNY